MSGRESDGTFGAGNKLSPGRPPSVFASQNDVADMLLKKYAPSEIIAIAGDPVRLDKECSSFQAMIMIQLANALSARGNNDNALERERLFDRVVGKPVSRTELTGKNGATLQINVITGVNAVDAEFVEVIAPTLDAIEDKRETELSSAEKKPRNAPPDGWEDRANAAQAKREAARAKARDYARVKAAERKASGVVADKKPSFNDRMAAKSVVDDDSDTSD